MADEQDLSQLLAGKGAWHRWRAERRGMATHDLSRADLSYRRFSRFNLSEVNLRGADLRRVIAVKSRLRNADLSTVSAYASYFAGCDLGETKFTAANLKGAYFRGGRLTNADFAWADLRAAAFYNVNLAGANLTGAKLGQTIFANTSLRDVTGLDSVQHDGPSTIGIDTFFRSGGLDPEFLRKAGAPEPHLAFAAQLAGATVVYYSCFISYSSADDEFAQLLYRDLTSSGIRTWFAAEDLRIGDRFRSRIEESIQEYDKLVLVFSSTSIVSAWVESEVETALERERHEHSTILFPVRLDDSVFTTATAWAASVRRTRHIGDFTAWGDPMQYRSALDRLLRDLRQHEPTVDMR